MKAGRNTRKRWLGPTALYQDQGFSLIEIVVASVILAAVLIPLLATLAGSHNLVYLGRDYLEANNLASQAAEVVKAAPLNEVEDLTPVDLIGQNSKYAVTKRVTPVPPDNKLKRVDLEIRQAGREMARISLILYDKGI